MNTAEEKALKAYPPILEYPSMMSVATGEKVDSNAKNREIFIQGYEAAELTWKDIKKICDIFMDCGLKSNLPARSKQFYEEVLKEYKKK